MTIKQHKNLLWLQVTAEQQAALTADPVLRALLLQVPVPGLLAIRISDRVTVLGRLEKLGVPPRLVQGAPR